MEQQLMRITQSLSTSQGQTQWAQLKTEKVRLDEDIVSQSLKDCSTETDQEKEIANKLQSFEKKIVDVKGALLT